MTNVQTLIDELRSKNPQYKDAESVVDAVHQIGALLGRIRSRKGWTQAQLGQHLGISAARVSQLEGGALRDAPSLTMLVRFAQACGETIKIAASGEQAQPEQKQTAMSADIVSGLAELRTQIADLSRPQAATEISALTRQVTRLQDEVSALRAAVEGMVHVPRYVEPVMSRYAEPVMSTHGIKMGAAVMHAEPVMPTDGTIKAGATIIMRGGPPPVAGFSTDLVGTQMLNGMAMAAQSVFTAAGIPSCKVSAVESQIADDGKSCTFWVRADQRA